MRGGASPYAPVPDGRNDEKSFLRSAPGMTPPDPSTYGQARARPRNEHYGTIRGQTGGPLGAAVHSAGLSASLFTVLALRVQTGFNHENSMVFALKLPNGLRGTN